MMPTRPMGMAVADFFGSGRAHVFHFNIEMQRLARQGMVGINSGHGMAHLEYGDLAMALVGMYRGGHARFPFFGATQVFYGDALLGIFNALTKSFLRRQADL